LPFGFREPFFFTGFASRARWRRFRTRMNVPRTANTAAKPPYRNTGDRLAGVGVIVGGLIPTVIAVGCVMFSG